MHGQPVAALHSYTHPTWLRFWGSGTCGCGCWAKRCQYVMVEAEGQTSNQTDFPIHIRHIKSVCAHWYAVHWHTVATLCSYTHPTSLGSDFGVLGHLWSQNDVDTSWLRLTATSNCFPHPYYTYTKCLSTFICCALTTSSSLTQLYPSYLDQILGFWVTCGVKMMSLRQGWGWGPPQTVLPSILDI